MTNCQLSQDRTYSLFVYIEDFNGNDDGILAGPLTFYVPSPRDLSYNTILHAYRVTTRKESYIYLINLNLNK